MDRSAQDLMRCDLCETAVVQMHCDTCLVNLCKACVGEHMLSNESKKHELVKYEDRKTTPLYPNCKTHNREECTMYCHQCDFAVCTECIASDHHKGHKLFGIMQVVKEKKRTFTKDQTELNDLIHPTYQDIASDVQNRMSQLEKEYEDLSTAIIKHGEDWHKEIDKIVKKLGAEVDEMKNTQLKILQTQLDDTKKTISQVQREINSIDVAIDSNDISKLFSVSFNVDRYKNLPKKILPYLPKFNAGKIRGKDIAKIFGTLSSSSVTTEEHGYRMKTIFKQLLDEPETVSTIDTGYKVYSVACLSVEEIWTSGNGKTMKLFSINQESLLKSITTKSGNNPTDVAVTESGDLVYTDYNDRTVNIVKNEKIEQVLREQEWRPIGVCSTSSDDFLVIMDSVYDKPSKVVRFFASSKKQTTLFRFPSSGYRAFITETRNLDICVSDSVAGIVTVVNQAGKLRFRYTGHTPAPKNKPFSPQGVTTDSQRHILTADCNNDCVHIIDQDGQFLRYIDGGLRYPYGLCTDMKENLFVVLLENKQVKKIKYMQ